MSDAKHSSKVTIHDVLGQFRQEATHKRDMGDKFERLVAGFLTKEPLYAQRFSNIWLWSEWDKRTTGDTGIDIVAEERATGQYCAIQCKFYDPNHSISKEEVDSFFSASDKEIFSSRLFVSTTDKFSSNAEDLFHHPSKKCPRIRLEDFENSIIDWSGFKLSRPADLKLGEKKKPREHQIKAIKAVCDGFKVEDRGKLIMACGTGKTFTSLKIAEKMATENKNILFLVPSISLLSQSLMEWTSHSSIPINAFAVCSDSKVGKKTDSEDIQSYDLAIPAHTDPKKLSQQVKGLRLLKPDNITVIFSTYQSIEVISESQKNFGLGEFDLIICDEAHRTAGLKLSGEEESHFLKVHDQKFVKSRKRLYMTATPKIFNDASKTQAEEADAVLYSMDKEDFFGKELHRLDFSEAVRLDLLSDYKVMVLAVDEKHVSKAFQHQLAEDGELKLPDFAKIVGCWNGLQKRIIQSEEDLTNQFDPSSMKRAVAFCGSIKDSKMITANFSETVNRYVLDSGYNENEDGKALKCEVDHVDGTFNSLQRNKKLQWLKGETPDGLCKILSNARCLSEGVDVPALDAVMFLSPRKSIIDVVQAVGRVMRKAEGKKSGYIILPIGVPSDTPPDQALNDNKRYQVVWQVLQALRAHDDRFDAIVNQIDLNKNRPDRIQVIGIGGNGSCDSDSPEKPKPTQAHFDFPLLSDWKDAIYAKIVIKCGNRKHWEQWAKDVAQIAERHITRINALLESSKGEYRQKFDQFLEGLRENLNPSISELDAVEMLAQHLITKPVFDSLFEGYEFTKSNPVSQTMQGMIDVLESQGLNKETESLQKFYASVKDRAKGIDNAEGRQKIIIELYDKFFKTAFPRMSERLGIVYTPVEVVDYIIQSANDALKSEFGVSLSDKDVHILDPFTGTGTFLVRLLQSGIIQDKDLTRKYRDEFFANEIVLLAYYIAAINIEEAYHFRSKKAYEPFEGISLTDTFQMSENESGSMIDKYFPENNQRVKKQRKKEIRVIIGNPPYSVGQKNANDDNQNQDYPHLNSRISETYQKFSNAGLSKGIYDSYIRALRWASDRIGKSGIICFVSNASFIDVNTMDGLRKCISDEFTTIYCFNLRGNIKISRLDSTNKTEGQNVFGQGSQTPIAITLFIKNPEKKAFRLFYKDIGDYLNRDEKLKIISDFGSFKNIEWEEIAPSKKYDWINQRDEAFEKFLPLGDKETKGRAESKTVFTSYSGGVSTNRDTWIYNFSEIECLENMRRMIDFYNQQVDEFKKSKAKNTSIIVDMFVDNNPKKIKWTVNLKEDLKRAKKAVFNKDYLRNSFYRPFCKQAIFFDKMFIERTLRIPSLFPEKNSENSVICVTGIGSRVGFSALILDEIPNLDLQEKSQCFPLYIYEYEKSNEGELSFGCDLKDEKKINISEFSFSEFQRIYKDSKIKKEDVFYYVYGVLHSSEYKKRFSSDLKKSLPRIPYVKDFWAFSKSGRKLAELHLNYESAKPYPVKEHKGDFNLDPKAFYRVEKIRFGKKEKEVDKTVIVYNSHLSISGIPVEAYEYVVNGKTAIGWIMDRYEYSIDKDSGIINDPNEYSEEPDYIFNLLKRVITVSVETVKIVKGLPALEELNRE